MDFSEKTDVRSFPLEIETETLWVSKEILSDCSPVFRTMFYGSFRESQEETIKLPGKKLADMRELLNVISPSVLKPVDAENVDLLLDLSREYSIDSLKRRCDHFLQKSLRKAALGSERHLDILILACKYDMEELKELCVPKVAQLPAQVIEGRHDDLPSNILATLYQAKLSKWKKHVRHSLTGGPCPASARPLPFGGATTVSGAAVGAGYGGPVGVFGNPAGAVGVGPAIGFVAGGGTLNYFCSSCNSSFTAVPQRLMCQFCKNTICDDCVRSRPCPKALEHDDTCDCECDYSRELLRRTN